MKKATVVQFVLAAFLAGAGCGEESSDLYQADGIYVDETTGIAWQALGWERNFLMGWEEAGMHCANLAISGEIHWRLPTADELLTLLRGCDQADCGVVDPDCLSENCAAECAPCAAESEGAGAACFLDAQVGGDCGVYWSSSHDGNGEDRAWAVDFETGAPRLSDTGSVWYVRCVRDAEGGDLPDSGT